jgi:hypothetical protein
MTTGIREKKRFRAFRFLLAGGLLFSLALGTSSARWLAQVQAISLQEKPTGPEKPASPEKAASQQEEQKPSVPLPLPKGKKLVLKDGSFQIVRSYERQGDRVRYYSVERSAWEEIPYDMVDWEATKRAEADEERRNREEIERIRAAQAVERASEIDVDASIEVVPGVFLPSGEGLWAVEGRSLSQLKQAAADVKLDKGRVFEQVISPIPVIPSRHRVQIPGKRATLRLTTNQPEFYMRTADAREPVLEAVRAEVKGDKRQIEQISTNIAGQQSAKKNTISLQSWKVARGVYRFTLSQSLEPGEYVLEEILPQDEGVNPGLGISLLVWDFGVDTRTSGSPVTNQRPGPQKPPASPKPKS